MGAAAVGGVLACLLAVGCGGHAIIDCAGPGVNVDLRDVGSRFPTAGIVTGCADGECITYRPGLEGTTERRIFVPLRNYGDAPKVTVTVTENGRTTFSAASSEQLAPHHGGQCSDGLFYVRVDSSGHFHSSGP